MFRKSISHPHHPLHHFWAIYEERCRSVPILNRPPYRDDEMSFMPKFGRLRRVSNSAITTPILDAAGEVIEEGTESQSLPSPANPTDEGDADTANAAPPKAKRKK